MILWRRTNRILQRPEPQDFKTYQQPVYSQANLQKQFGEYGLRIIVELANIEVIPEKLTYDGGSWHVEGQLNKRICVTALYYNNSNNIADNYLTFRHRTTDKNFELKTHVKAIDRPSNTKQRFGVSTK